MMKIDELKMMSEPEVERALALGQISYFEYGFRDFLLGRCGWRHFTGPDLIALRERLTLTQETFGYLLNVSKQTVLRWEKDGELIPQWADPVLTCVDRLEGGLFEVMRSPCNRPGEVRDLLGSVYYHQRYRGDAYELPEVFEGEEVKTLRARLRMTRKAFAELIDVSLSTVDKWESGAVKPKGPALTVLKLVWKEGPDVLKGL